MIFDKRREVERANFVANYAYLGFTYLNPERQESFGLTPISGRMTSWVLYEDKIGVLKRADLGQIGKELWVSDLAEASGILAPKVKAIRLADEDKIIDSRNTYQFALCFSPKIGEEPKPVFDYLKAADRGVVVADEVSCYLSSYLPFNYLTANVDLHDQNLIVSYDKNKKNDGKDKAIVYAIDNELASLYPAHQDCLFDHSVWPWLFNIGNPFYIDTKRVQESAARVSSLRADVVAAAVETMHRFVTDDCIDKEDFKDDLAILQTRLGYIQKNFAESKGIESRIEYHLKSKVNFSSPSLG